jgi:poly(glycerol-phosphate) alpha-glucosyltransferase
VNVAFLSPLSRTGGGIFEIARSLALTLASMPDTALEVYGPQDAFTAEDLGSWRPITVTPCKTFGLGAFAYSPAMRKALFSGSADIAHLHSLWTYPSLLVHNWSRKTGRPYVTTLNGMLDPWALKNSFFKKKVAAALYAKSSLARSGCIQVNSEAELNTARAFGLRNPIAIIPNGVAIPDLRSPLPDLSDHPVAALKGQSRKLLLYLGRLHPKKGLPDLLTALHRLRAEAEGWKLVIAGWSQGGHESELRERATSMQLGDRVVFLGSQFGAHKELCFRQADAFILPSLSEGLPMAVLEAWSYAKPVLMTPACSLPAGYAAGAAIRIEPDVSSIEQGLRQLFGLSDSDLEKLGQNGRALVARSFSWASVAGQIRCVYEWLLRGGPAPGCVVY